ncbi:hypothetical protein AU255_02150 [Methyloprofundus sedimenti]|uniref:Uncharacterized protein n=1 Tax=Methyloprofundus sedimenti TaxID=1420851 RepID=A0A1V8M591_9GAMM|nr:hypothetical protein AU255_02150 [Methyloprofundus sedimenti]
MSLNIRFSTTLYLAQQNSCNIATVILALNGQVINKIELNEGNQKVVIRCEGDKRSSVIDPLSTKP